HKNVILKFEALGFCPTVTSIDRRGQSTMLAFAQRVASWFAPRPLYASSAVVLGGTGGLLRGLSPIGAVSVNVTTVKLTIQSQPTTGFINTPITPAITVRALTANDTPLDGLTIRLDITGNNGSYIVKEGTNIAVTANGGIATFSDLEISKAGGYTFVAVGYFDANGPYTQPSAVSLMINLSGQPQ
ncbi:MAG: hypothetical protein K0S86_4173, partial [Geminicoccaceae bacterium]|nr:hypothetical protein [Geminicoccaceae bacterium]